MKPAEVISGDSPIILGQPHSGTFVPTDIFEKLNALGRELRDTDWHIPELYSGVLPDATIVRANFSRYVIDANRDPEGSSLYPGQNTTQLVPLQSFDAEPIWNTPPSPEDIAARIERFHRPYHAAIEAEIERVKSIHGFAVLYDCHSIRSRISYLFEDQLPDLNVGNNSGQTCAPDILEAVKRACTQQSRYSYVFNGRFKGGWTTRHYGRPQDNVHAVQMEISQHNYLQSETPPFAYDAQHAQALKTVLGEVFKEIIGAIHTLHFHTES